MLLIVLIFITCMKQHSHALTETASMDPSESFRNYQIWRKHAIQILWQERRKMGRTPMFKLKVEGFPNAEFLFKNESSAVTGSIKHRYSWALIMWAIIEGNIKEQTTVYESSSGNTATSEAYFCQLIGVKFIAIVPHDIEPKKERNIRNYGGDLIKTERRLRLKRAQEEAERNSGFFMNQFANSERAEEYHRCNDSTNLLHEILMQINNDRGSRHLVPNYFVHCAGTGGTITSIGRYAKKYNIDTQIVLSDPETSAYYDYILHGKYINNSEAQVTNGPGLSGIGYSNEGPIKFGISTSLQSHVIDQAIKINNLAAIAAMRVLQHIGIDGGISTAANFLTCLHIAAFNRKLDKNLANQNSLLIATVLGDSGEYYQDTYLNNSWIQKSFKSRGGLLAYQCWIQEIQNAIQFGVDPLAKGREKCANGDYSQTARNS